MRITKEQYEEFEKLKKWAKKEKVFKSAKDIKNLEDDVDAPIKRCVAMLALLGCEPVYSCCGFDYDGQPFHKSHQYGRPYFILTSNKMTDLFIYELHNIRSLWVANKNGKFVNLELMVGANPFWRKEDCIHFSEECVIQIAWLENVLVQTEEHMVDFVELLDTNNIAKNNLKYWQYPPKKSWKIFKKDVLPEPE